MLDTVKETVQKLVMTRPWRVQYTPLVVGEYVGTKFQWKKRLHLLHFKSVTGTAAEPSYISNSVFWHRTWCNVFSETLEEPSWRALVSRVPNCAPTTAHYHTNNLLPQLYGIHFILVKVQFRSTQGWSHIKIFVVCLVCKVCCYVF